MSLTVLVVPENPTYNGHILQPLVERILKACKKPRAKVTVMTNPSANGYDHAKQLIQEEVPNRYKHMDLILFLPDRDGRDDRQADLDRLEKELAKKGLTLICCAAIEEVETWLLAGHVEKLGRPWTEVSNDGSVKEVFFESFLRQHGRQKRAGGGRDLLMKETLRNYKGLKSRCPEIKTLEDKIRKALATQ